MTRTIIARLLIARLLVLLVVWSLTALFVVLQADRVAGIRLAAAEIELQEAAEGRPQTWQTVREQYVFDYIRNRNSADASAIASAIASADLDPLLVLAIIEVESSFQLRNPKTKDGRGLAGEYGLMQIHPCWIGNDAIGSPTVAELWSIDGNIAAGVAIFKRGYTDDYLAGLGHFNTGGKRNKVYENKVDAVYLKLRGEFYFRLRGVR